MYEGGYDLSEKKSQKKPPGKNTKKLFQGQYERTKHWFDLGIEQAEGKFNRREPQFYKRPFQINIEVQSGPKYPALTVLIGNAKLAGEIEYDPKSPLVEYHNNDSNSCCFISVASEFTVSG